MDQVKTAFAFVKKNHFWFGCCLCVLVALVFYFVGARKFSTYFAAQKSTSSTASQAVSPLIGAAAHPNDEWIKEVQKQTDQERLDVLAAWTKLYQDQSAIFRWPADQELGDDFRAAMNQPIGKSDMQTMGDLCERYQKFIVLTLLPRMAKIVDAEWTAGNEQKSRAGLEGPGARHVSADPGHMVVWSNTDQEQQFRNYNWDSTPSELAVRYAQEDMWVMEALFKAIAAANDGSPSFNPVVRQIDQVQIGYDAVGKHPLGEGEVRLTGFRPRKEDLSAAGPGVPGGFAGPGGGNGGAPAVLIDVKRPDPKKLFGKDTDARGPVGVGYGPSAGPGVPGGAQGGFGAQPGQAPTGDPTEMALKNGRYVGSDGKPLAAADMPTTQNEYKLMEFHIRVVADQRRFQRVIAALGASTVPMELREVRVGAVSSGDVNGPEENIGPRRSDQRSSNGDITLDLKGIAYIINPPDPTKIGLTADSGAAPAGGATAAPATGATTAPAGTTAPVATGTGAATPAAPPAAAPTTAAPASGAVSPVGTPTVPATAPTGTAPAGTGTTGPATPAPATSAPATGTTPATAAP